MRAHSRHVIEPLRVGPMPSKHALTEWLALDLPHGAADAGPFKAELQPADASEQATNAPVPPSHG